MRTTRTWTERSYEASLFPRIGFGIFLRNLGERRRRPPSGGPEPSVRYHFGRARTLDLCQDLRAKGQSQLGGKRRMPPSGGPKPSVRYHSGRARILTLCQDLRAKGHLGGRRRMPPFEGARAMSVIPLWKS
ncbi:hypothetical protein Gogos_011621 [Gossypium gossypioides]|uniref:Uncharacterized protein n=1 Tax=Gossypium gossypioides TaxID=34282 RepID=A0A7J9BPW1_GOSGO|nr:hypothetical protein [Gossypium gossypioides]